LSRIFANSFIILILSVNLIYSQSDFRITQEFKSRLRSFEIAIEYAKTPDELTKIKKEIVEFKNEFRGNKELLNRALYPGNFESSFSTLNKKIEFTSRKIEEIANLNTQVTSLKSDYEKISDELQRMTSEINSLRNTNAQLMTELRAIKSGYGGSKEKIDSLTNIISQLKKGISQRDTLIKEIMDNIFLTAEHRVESLDDAELKGIKSKVENTSLIENIRNLVHDNIDFLNASILTFDDLSNLRNEFNQFEDRWQHFGPKLFDIYSSDKQNKEKLVQIDSLITDWDTALNVSVFKSIDEEFRQHNIEIPPFTNGEEFEANIISYIDEQIENSSNLQVQKDNELIFFADNVWENSVKTKWVPVLLKNNLITTNQITHIDNKIEEWKSNVGGSKSLLIYGVILLLAIVIIVIIYLIVKKKRKKSILNEDNENLNVKIDENKGEDFDEDFIDDDPNQSDKN